MKRIAVLLSCVALLAIASSCNKPEPAPQPQPQPVNPTSITISPTTVSLSVGETQQLTAVVEPTDHNFSVTYSSNKAEVATVDNNGLVTAVAEGEAMITATVGDLSATAKVTVEGATISAEQELPLLNFDPKKDESEKIIDPEILAYEEKLGRQPQEISYSSKLVIPGFVNKDLSVIPAVAYGIEIEETADIILCYSKEPVENATKTKEMLGKLGFTKFEKVNVRIDSDGNTVPGFRSRNDKNKEISLVAKQDFSHKGDFGASMSIEIQRHYLIPTEHKILVNAKDAPSIETLLTKDSKKIKDFENTLGLRVLEESEEGSVNQRFNTKPECVSKTNLAWVLYVRTSFFSDQLFINSQSNAVAGYTDLYSDDFKNYLANIGFDKNYQIIKETVLAENAQGDTCMGYIDLMFNCCYIQFVPKESMEQVYHGPQRFSHRALQSGMTALDRPVTCLLDR